MDSQWFLVAYGRIIEVGYTMKSMVEAMDDIYGITPSERAQVERRSGHHVYEIRYDGDVSMTAWIVQGVDRARALKWVF